MVSKRIQAENQVAKHRKNIDHWPTMIRRIYSFIRVAKAKKMIKSKMRIRELIIVYNMIMIIDQKIMMKAICVDSKT